MPPLGSWRVKVFFIFLALSRGRDAIGESDALKCSNDGFQVGNTCQCSSPYIKSNSSDNSTQCTEFDCLNYGVPSVKDGFSSCSCPPGFLGFHCEPVRCVPEQLNVLSRSKTLSLYTIWNDRLHSGRNDAWINGSINDFVANNTDMVTNIMFNDELKSCATDIPKCVSAALSKFMAQPANGPSSTPISGIQKLVEMSAFQSQVIVWTNVPLNHSGSELEVLLQTAVAKRIKINIYVGFTNIVTCREGSYLCEEFKDLRRVARATLGVFLAPYMPKAISRPFKRSMSTLSSAVLSPQYFHTVLSSTFRQDCSIINIIFTPVEGIKYMVKVVSASEDKLAVMDPIIQEGDVVHIVADAGKWMLFELDQPALMSFNNQFPCNFETWAINSKNGLNVAFTTNREADATATVPFYAETSSSQLFVLQYTSSQVSSVELSLLFNASVATLSSSANALSPRLCQYNYQLPNTLTCTGQGEFLLLVALNKRTYTEVVPLYCSAPDDRIQADLEIEDDELLDSADAESSAATTSEPPHCPETSGNRTFVLVMANYPPLLQKFFNVTESESLLVSLLDYAQKVKFNQYATTFVSRNGHCKFLVSDNLTGLKNNLLHNILSYGNVEAPQEWNFAKCLQDSIQKIEENNADVFILTPGGIGSADGYKDTLKVIQSTRAAINFIETYKLVSNTPSALFFAGSPTDPNFITTQNFEVAEDTQFVFVTTCGVVCSLVVDGKETQVLEPMVSTISTAMFNVTLPKGTHNLTIESSFNSDVIYKLSILKEKKSDLLIAFNNGKGENNLFMSYGYNEYPLIGGKLGNLNGTEFQAFSGKLQTLAPPSPFTSQNESTCYNQIAEKGIFCSDTNQVYLLRITSPGFTTRTYPFACVPSNVTCANGQMVDGKCKCYPGWTNPPYCTNSTACENGGHHLEDSTCQCPTGFQGKRCEKYSGSCQSKGGKAVVKYESQLDSVAVVVEYIHAAAVAKDVGDLGFARQYTVIRFQCNQGNCFTCGVPATSNEGSKLGKLFGETEKCVTVQEDPLKAALDIQIGSRSLVIFIGNSATISAYSPSSEIVTLVAKRKAEVRFVAFDTLPSTKYSVISLSPPVKYDATYFANYINGVLPTDGSADRAFYIVSRENKTKTVSPEPGSSYFVTFAKAMDFSPITGSTSVSKQIFIVSKPENKTFEINTTGVDYVIEVLSPRKIAFGINTQVSDETRNFAIINGTSSYLNFFSTSWPRLSTTNAPIVTVGDSETLATQKTDSKSCSYVWTTQISCQKLGINAVEISFEDTVRTINIFCVPESVCSSLHPFQQKTGQCQCDVDWGDLDCSRPTCGHGILDGDVCNCPFPLSGSTCRGSAPRSTTAGPSTPSTVGSPALTTPRPKSCVSKAKVNLVLFFDSSKINMEYISQYKSVLRMLTSDFVVSNTSTLVGIYGVRKGVFSYILLCAVDNSLSAAIDKIAASSSITPKTVQEALDLANRRTKEYIAQSCPFKKYTNTTYVVYLTANDGSASDVVQSEQKLSEMEGNNFVPLVLGFSKQNQPNKFWTELAEKAPKNVFTLTPDSDEVIQNVVEKMWTAICRYSAWT
ncbi:hypothetical protein L596_003701 [Steinernema carpocapsae]|uniref:EGF-like domain-containing protein n=1 Tax=Steinernema carpocapsae TaxID=34508 RepID=A0A4U8UTF7_STECR|nr:hypothetical protein L596_003701 [Steinernema carpocapsae]